MVAGGGGVCKGCAICLVVTHSARVMRQSACGAWQWPQPCQSPASAQRSLQCSMCVPGAAPPLRSAFPEREGTPVRACVPCPCLASALPLPCPVRQAACIVLSLSGACIVPVRACVPCLCLAQCTKQPALCSAFPEPALFQCVQCATWQCVPCICPEPEPDGCLSLVPMRMCVPAIGVVCRSPHGHEQVAQ